jgi:hypothetical protein
MPLDMDPQEELNQLLAILTTSLDNARLKLWPQGVPFTKTPRPGTWINGEPATLTLITSKHKAYMRLRALQRNPDASAEELQKAMIASKAANKRVKKQLKRTREKHFIRLAKRIQAAHDAKDYRLYYKLANLVSLPERKEITRGPQLLDQKQVRKLDKTLTRNVEEKQVRWKEHWMGLFNQPGEAGPGIEALLPTQLPTNLDILDTPFTSAELSAGLPGR